MNNIGDVSLCGLGPMGFPIAERILESHHALTVWNRTISKAAPLVTRGAQVATTPREAACNIVLTVLPDLPQVQALTVGAQGLIAGWREREITEPVLVIHGTTSPVSTKTFAEQILAEHGVRVIDAPLSGGTVGAAEGSLSIMLGGDAALAERLKPLFYSYGHTIRYFGASGSGAIAKACNQIVVAANVAALAEAFVLAERSGIDRDALVQVLEGGLAASELLQQKKSKWLIEDYHEGGSASNQLKDLRFAQDTASSSGAALPVLAAVSKLFEKMLENGDGCLDHTGVIRTVRKIAEE